MSQAEQIDINRLRRQVSFDRLLARLFQEDPAPWVLKGLKHNICIRWKGESMARSAARLKMGYYPLPDPDFASFSVSMGRHR